MATTIVGFLLASIIFLTGCTATSPPRARPDFSADFKAVHLDASRTSNTTCLQCHAGLVSRTSRDGVTPTFHYMHVEQQGQACGSCHERVDIAAQRPAALASPRGCAACHEPFQKAFDKR